MSADAPVKTSRSNGAERNRRWRARVNRGVLGMAQGEMTVDVLRMFEIYGVLEPDPDGRRTDAETRRAWDRANTLFLRQTAENLKLDLGKDWLK